MPPRRRQLLIWSRKIVVALAIYLVSIGPILLACEHLDVPRSFVERLYAPLSILPSTGIISRVLGAYVEWWIGPVDCGGTGGGG